MTLPVIPAWPSRFAIRETYNSAAAAFGNALPGFVSASNTLFLQCMGDSARAAALAETRGAIKWISGTSYADGFTVWSPANFMTYRRKGAGAGTTDPSADSANWQELTFRPKITRDARTSNTVLGGLDIGKLIDVTTASFTQTFAAVATLGAGWWCIIHNSSAAALTLDPNGSELIDGLATYKMYAGEARLIQCDGSALRSVVLKPFYQRFTASETFTTPPGYRAIGGLLWGGGESGERTNSLESNSKGGAGGGLTRFLLPVSAVGASQSLTIGAGGAAVTGVANGNPGGNTSFGSLAIGYGGGTITANCGGGRAAITAASPVGFEGATAAAGQPSDAIHGGGASSTDGLGDSGYSFFAGGAGGSVAENSTVGGAAVSLLGSTINTTAGAKTVTATPAVGDLIVIVLQASKATAASLTFSAPTDNNSSGTYTQVGTGSFYCTDNSTFRVYGAVYVRDNLIASASSTIFTMPAPVTDDGGGLAVLKITGMSKAGSSAIRQVKADYVNTASTLDASTGLWTSARLTTNPTIGVVVNSANPAAMTPTPGFTELLDTGYATPTTGIEIQSRDSGDTGNSMVWTRAASYWACIGVELDATNLVAGTPNAAGGSGLGGAGGVGSSAGNGTAGSVPGGGGGATQTGTSSGAGGAGAADLYGVC